MGSWFSNLHIRKNKMLTEQILIEHIQKRMVTQGYQQVASEDEADAAYAIITNDESQWFSLYSDQFSFDSPKSVDDYATPLSQTLETDVLGIACFDSDYLFMNLINASDHINAWANVGRFPGLGMLRRTNLSAWKKKVDDFPQFKLSLRKKYVFAEEILEEIAPCVHLPFEYCNMSYEYIRELEIPGEITYLHFKLSTQRSTQELPALEEYMSSLDPCFIDRPHSVSVINVGGASKGLTVCFVGPYVERDEITLSDVCLLKHKNYEMEIIPVELKKTQLSDGQWAYCYTDPNYQLPPKVDPKVSPMKRMSLEMERNISVRFIPHGNTRKILDITVVLMPNANPMAQAVWNVWQRFGSKQEYIRYHNQHWSKSPNHEYMLLKEEDFDL